MADIKVGEVVKSKSGGPNMVVNEFTGAPGFARCTWFTKDRQLMQGDFAPEGLSHVPRDKKVED